MSISTISISLSTSSTKSDPGQNCSVGCTNRHAGDTLGIYDVTII